MDDKTFTCVSEHELVAEEDKILREIKSQECEKVGESHKTHYCHTRSITKDGKTDFYCVKMTVEDGRPSTKLKETNLTDEKLEAFENEWKAHWDSILDKND